MSQKEFKDVCGRKWYYTGNCVKKINLMMQNIHMRKPQSVLEGQNILSSVGCYEELNKFQKNGKVKHGVNCNT